MFGRPHPQQQQVHGIEPHCIRWRRICWYDIRSELDACVGSIYPRLVIAWAWEFEWHKCWHGGS